MYNNDDGLDWDYYEYGQKEEQEKQKQQGMGKLIHQNVVYSDKTFDDEQFNHFKISPNMEELSASYGIYSKGNLLKQAGNLKLIEKQEIKIENQSFKKAIVPKVGQNTLLSSTEDHRIKSGSVVSTFPNTAIGIVVAYFKSGLIQRGTGQMCSPNHVITAGHVLISEDKSELTQVQYLPGVVGDHIIYKEPKVIRALCLQKDLPLKPENDIGILVLDFPLGLYSGWFGLAYLPDEYIQNQKIEVVGYPLDKQNQNNEISQFSQEGKILKLNEGNLFYGIEATEGQNGGAVYSARVISQTDQELFILGIHTGRDQKSNTCNIGARLSQKNMETITQIIEYYLIHDSLEETFFNRLLSDQYTYIADFEECNTTLKNSSDMMYSIRNNLNLKDIQIRIKNKKGTAAVNDASIKELADSLKLIRHVENLKIDLFGCDNLTDEALRNLGQGISHLKDLRTLLITLNANSKFTNNGIKDLVTNFASLGVLESLSLFLYNLKTITEESGKFLGAGISKIPRLNRLKLDFNLLKKVGEKGIKNLCSSLETCKHIESMSFVFMGMGVDPSFKQDLKKKFKNVKSFSVV